MTQAIKTRSQRLNYALDIMEIRWREYAAKKKDERLLLRYVRSLRRVNRLMDSARIRQEVKP